MVKIKIVNVVATASINQQVDFEALRQAKEIFHDSDVYGGRVAYFKKTGMEGKVSIFTSGKMISIGTKSESQAFNELETTVRFLVEKNFANPAKLEPRIRNIVVTVDFERIISLEKLAENQAIVYEPEQFPAAILHQEKPFKSTILVFSSGKAIITGLTNSRQIGQTIVQLENVITQRGD
jgi:TATA-box binding protein (TBP) (component of TFIID and TFIIIB)